MNKVKMPNNNIRDIKYTSKTNRSNNRNINKNPNLFFIETGVLKSERNIIKKSDLKKRNIKTKVGPILTFSPLK